MSLLNVQEFGDQGQLFDPGPREPLAPRPWQYDDRPYYPDPHRSLGVNDVPNPLFDPQSELEILDDFPEITGVVARSAEERWVHPPNLVSPQDTVHEPSVAHLAERNTGLEWTEEEPIVAKVRDREVLVDGNHRANAAMRRGQMFMPVRYGDVDKARLA